MTQTELLPDPDEAHNELVYLGARHLTSTRRCSVVITERGAFERPDCIGFWNNGRSVLLECKTSLGDFRADQKKKTRRGGGMGSERYYLTRKGLLDPGELPDGWGLLEARGSRVFTVLKSFGRDDWARPAETRLLISELRDWDSLKTWFRGPTRTFLDKYRLINYANNGLEAEKDPFICSKCKGE